MSEEQSRRQRRVTYTQLLNLWEFLNTHREIASGYNKSAQAREHSKLMWLRVALILNSVGEGAIKSGPEWSKYWVDLKAKIKRKNRVIRDARSRTGGGPSVSELNEIELKFLQILGEDYGSGLPGVQVQPFVIQQDNTDDIIHPGRSQPTESDEGSEEPRPIYLEIINSSEQENVVQENVPISPSVSVQSPHQIQSAQIPSIHQSEPAQMPPPQQQSVPSAPPEPQSSQARSRQDPLRRRRQRRRTLTAADAREQLVSASQARAQAELANSQSIAQGVRYLGEITEILRSMAESARNGAPRGD